MHKNSDNTSPIGYLPTTAEIIRESGVRAKKSLGQNYITDHKITDKIVSYVSGIESRHVLEIGCGPGGLSQSIMKSKPASLTCIEMDSTFTHHIQNMAGHYQTPFRLVMGDALKTDYKEIAREAKGRLTVIANLPYNISVPLLMLWMQNLDCFDEFILMFQKEVAERILAKHGCKAYGRVSVICQVLCEGATLTRLPPGVFSPPPKVDSAVIRLIPRQKKLAEHNINRLDDILKSAFAQRRKMVKSNLSTAFVNPAAALELCGIKPNARAEEISIEEFCKLSVVENI